MSLSSKLAAAEQPSKQEVRTVSIDFFENKFRLTTCSLRNQAISMMTGGDMLTGLQSIQMTSSIIFYSVNKVELVGGVALDPLFKKAKNDKPYLLFNIITNSFYKQADGNTIDQVNFFKTRISSSYLFQTERHAVTVFGKQAESLSKIIKKGSRLMVQGRLHYSGGVKDEQVGLYFVLQ